MEYVAIVTNKDGFSKIAIEIAFRQEKNVEKNNIKAMTNSTFLFEMFKNKVPHGYLWLME